MTGSPAGAIQPKEAAWIGIVPKVEAVVARSPPTRTRRALPPPPANRRSRGAAARSPATAANESAKPRSSTSSGRQASMRTTASPHACQPAIRRSSARAQRTATAIRVPRTIDAGAPTRAV
ncbi:MAG TPA: hypothetical protein VFP76_02795 [Gemmatimonadota bacterium]|nr:hypothetical protein [Gemmatimonadota bacterium]